MVQNSDDLPEKRLYVRLLSGRVVVLLVRGSDTIGEVKQQLATELIRSSFQIKNHEESTIARKKKDVKPGVPQRQHGHRPEEQVLLSRQSSTTSFQLFRKLLILKYYYATPTTSTPSASDQNSSKCMETWKRREARGKILHDDNKTLVEYRIRPNSLLDAYSILHRLQRRLAELTPTSSISNREYQSLQRVLQITEMGRIVAGSGALAKTLNEDISFCERLVLRLCFGCCVDTRSIRGSDSRADGTQEIDRILKTSRQGAGTQNKQSVEDGGVATTPGILVQDTSSSRNNAKRARNKTNLAEHKNLATTTTRRAGSESHSQEHETTDETTSCCPCSCSACHSTITGICCNRGCCGCANSNDSEA